MYSGVPIASGLDVDPCPESSRSRAIPKSRSFTSPSRVMKTLSGLRSRCTTPLSCAAASTSRIRSASKSTSAGDSAACRRLQRSRTVSPSSRSITRKNAPSSVTSSSSTEGTPGCSILFAMYPSRRNRARSFGLVDSSKWSIFTATRLPFLWVAA
jgi:hypothetical protein